MKLRAHGSAAIGLEAEYESEHRSTEEARERLYDELESMSDEEIREQLEMAIGFDEIERIE